MTLTSSRSIAATKMMILALMCLASGSARHRRKVRPFN